MTKELELNRIYQMDCLEGMQLIQDGSIDMILCDLPYGTTRNKWDSVIDLRSLWVQYERIIKDSGAIVLTAQTPFDKVLGASNLQLLRYEWIWEKTQPTGHLNAKKMPMKAHENILVFYKKLPTYNPEKTTGHERKVSLAKHKANSTKSTNYNDYGLSSYDSTERYPRSIQVFASDKQKEALHPTQKPVALFEYLIRTYTNEGETVLDNCIGSGTTAVAAIRTNRNFIGFEREHEYVQISNQRIKTIQDDVIKGCV
ncbi:site-specific DNA-methyltransferase [Peribacillus butanolivorans]|uniref:DNA-methyltransferase n=1 Tax=Peribacillus butanolivorans TaxID=421767 RepID=UPI00207CA641|nr:site-specific DNA-methyltransferase [Peribacillus butanolivorans]MCO0597391.1 site-specific DNA-methyltransferase [Peribacillus butanolivorans]